MRGATIFDDNFLHTFNNFNPHSPCGERPFRSLLHFIIFEFQSTLPMRGATYQTAQSLYRLGFQSTLPMRGATVGDKQGNLNLSISIHTPHAGSDLYASERARIPSEFQSTLPMRGATGDSMPISDFIAISIHTPHAGSDY